MIQISYLVYRPLRTDTTRASPATQSPAQLPAFPAPAPLVFSLTHMLLLLLGHLAPPSPFLLLAPLLPSDTCGRTRDGSPTRDGTHGPCIGSMAS